MAYNAKQRVAPYLLILFIGFLIGFTIIVDPYVTAYTLDFLNTSLINNHHIVVYPYFLTTFLLLLFVLFAGIVKPIVKKIALFPEKAFLLIFFISFNTLSLTEVAGHIDGGDLATGIIFLLFVFQALTKEEKVIISLLDMLNLLMIATILLCVIHNVLLFVRLNTILKYTLMSFVFSNLVYKKNLTYFFIKMLLISTTISAGIAIIQELIYMTTRAVVIGKYDPRQLKLMFEDTPFGRALRVPAFVGSYKTLAFLLITNILIVVNFIFYMPRYIKKFKKSVVSALIIMSGALFLTFSKDSMLALSITLLFSFFVRWPNLIIHGFTFSLVLIVVVISYGLVDDIYNAILSELSYGELRIRVILNKEGILGFINQYFFTGTGITDGSKYTASINNWPSHNAFILTAVEIGIFGLTVYAMLFIYTFANLIWLNTNASRPREKALFRGLFMSMICLLIVFQTHAGHIDIILWLYMAFIQGIVLVKRRELAAKNRAIISI
ncbi:MAG: O-antigen ligase family protein [Candidatus Magnetoovum sp. WYHC-5]|nr:O-antigen ligase family protein [Candidatus Magnetoovum sp. WYHC-5]